ncbi:DUF2491 family protein [Pseudoduganella namucuonensis]|uniref:DUF2491 family protein n=1 Tax=Pseudoduganella namucuonensis TaxID=1035707 RepID=A0A1I7G552_9BURK|nr:DUF2491 family protein [Pseudoduganella namucuonensis]SFU43559.1 Protein of unknown function [Pseudoduganella namucuonensis]
MGWKDAFEYVKGAAGKRGMTEAPADQQLPLGARIGSVVTMQQGSLLRASTAGSLIQPPTGADTRILAISRLKLNLSGSVYRYYLDTGDDQADEKFLQVYVNAQGEVAEVMYCTQLARVIPETVEDQQAYTGELGYGLGDRSYTLWRAQLGDYGLDEADLDLVFGQEEGVDYRRDAGNADAEFVQPYTGSETRIDDAAGVQGMKQDLYFMPYVRELPGAGPEFLLITTEILRSVNGDANKRGIHVDFVIGIPVEQERIVIQ